MRSFSCFQIAIHKTTLAEKEKHVYLENVLEGLVEVADYFIHCPLWPESLLCCPFVPQTRVPKR